MEPNETIAYKGLNINICQDDDARSPDEMGDTEIIMLGFDRRNFWVEHENFTQGMFACAFNKNKYEDGSLNTDAKELNKNYHIFPLNAYIHSGISLSLTDAKYYDITDFYDAEKLLCVGAVLIAKKLDRTKLKARAQAAAHVSMWNDYLSGSVYGFMAGNNDDENAAGSCWGFFGYDHEASGLLEHAKSDIDAYYEWTEEEYQRTKERHDAEPSESCEYEL
jgi:hypothetical protein